MANTPIPLKEGFETLIMLAAEMAQYLSDVEKKEIRDNVATIVANRISPSSPREDYELYEEIFSDLLELLQL
ncbi:MAG: hypothetical protein OXH16_01320 [Gemmatimonadetes bacterium]|nr:hypothetical protein [Gemmatimonadota bacterium]